MIPEHIANLEHVAFSIKQHVATIKIDNYEKRNAISRDIAQAMAQCLYFCDDHPDVKVIVLRGSHGHFSGGGDVKAMHEKVLNNTVDSRQTLRATSQLILAIIQNSKPVVAWLEGSVAGGGLSIAMACDFAVAQEEALFTFAFVNIGFVPDMGSSLLLTKNIGVMKAKQLMMTGKRFSGKEAEALGIVTQSFPKETMDEQMMKIIDKLVQGPTAAYTRIKRLVNRNVYEGIASVLDLESEYQYQLCSSEDHKEAIMAFFEKRKPKFKGE